LPRVSASPRVVRLHRAHDLDELHEWHGIEEVHADHGRRALRGGGDLGQRDRGRVRCQNCGRLRESVHVTEERELDVEVLGGRFDDEVGRCERCEARRGLDAREGRIAILALHLALRDERREVLLDATEAALCHAFEGIDEQYIEPTASRHLRDALAHLAGTDHAQRLDNAHVTASRF
jgi:hypothetical protein